MQMKIMSFDKRVDIGQPYIRILVIIFVAALLSKGPVIFHGYAIDDYMFTSTVDLQVYFSQGRYLLGAIAWLINSLGAHLADMYFPFGILTLLLQTAFIVSILRFVGIENSPGAGLVGALIISHPYVTEILTFRMALTGYCVALIFSILALEMVIRRPTTWGARVLALLSTFAMVTIYQVFLNYFAVAIIFAFIYGQVLHHNSDQSSVANNGSRERALTLTIISAISAVASLGLVWLANALGITYVTGRANPIAIDKIPERIQQISSSLVNIYWSAEPVFSGWLKTLVALMLVLSIAIIFWRLLTKRWLSNSIGNIFVTVFACLLLVPVSLGVIIPFGDWWPVPRVIAHVAIIIGLFFLVADTCIQDLNGRFLKVLIFTSRIIVLIGFVILSNQIMADQQRINQWDRMMANRIISRLEVHPNFGSVRFVYINKGGWSFPTNLSTIQGDMNISAFAPKYSRVPLLSEVSGYRFVSATGSNAAVGEKYCKSKQAWPHAESVTVDNDVAIICLEK